MRDTVTNNVGYNIHPFLIYIFIYIVVITINNMIYEA